MNSTMFNAGDILETIRMIQDECLDIRTTTMGISLLDCIDPDINKACDKVYDKITRKAEKLVETGEKIEKEYGIPIINKRIAVTPIAMLAAACPKENPVKFAKALQRAAETCGVNFVGGYSALVHKGFSAGDLELIRSIPEALDVTTRLCSSVNVGSTRSGINMDAATASQAPRATRSPPRSRRRLRAWRKAASSKSRPSARPLFPKSCARRPEAIP